jgi:predicted amidohydrolase YtcJ
MQPNPSRNEITIIENARIYTMDRDMPGAEALAWRDGRVLAVGDGQSVRQAVRTVGTVGTAGAARRVDLGGRAVIPGLVDAHIHFLSYSRSLTRIQLDGIKSKEEAVAMVAARAREVGPGRWILGGGWNNNLWSPPEFPTRHDLDLAAPHNPVLLDRKDGHSCWVNSAVLHLAGISRDTPDPPGAAIGRDEAGEPDGMLYESAVQLARGAVQEPRQDDAAVMRRGMTLLAGMGLTGIHDCEGPEAFRVFQDLSATGELGQRVVMLLPYRGLDDAIKLGLRTGFGSDRLAIGPVKIFSDGSLGSRTAEMLEPYEGYPGYTGIGTIPQDELEEAIARASEAGIPSAVHAIGDAANRRVLDAFQKARGREKARAAGPLAHRIEHAQLLHPDDIPRFAALGVAASMQPLHATSDMSAADRLWGERSRYSYAWRSLLDAGALVAFGSDAPVETPDPFAGIHAAVTRQDADDLPKSGWYPEERITVEEAVRAYTEGAARSAPYLPGVTGALTPGSAADLLVLDRDIFKIEPSEIKAARPVATLVAGEAVYDRERLFAR